LLTDCLLQLAKAGFYFNPMDGHPDNVTCFLCEKDLDGWEHFDDPTTEHLKHCPDCGWAKVASVLATRDANSHTENPRGGPMVEARIMTFGTKRWPHEDKKEWIPKIEAVGFKLQRWHLSGSDILLP
jgi:NAD-dependent SIR2 family protein deacetylase